MAKTLACAFAILNERFRDTEGPERDVLRPSVMHRTNRNLADCEEIMDGSSREN